MKVEVQRAVLLYACGSPFSPVRRFSFRVPDHFVPSYSVGRPSDLQTDVHYSVQKHVTGVLGLHELATTYQARNSQTMAIGEAAKILGGNSQE